MVDISLGCSLLSWKNGLPVTELNMQLIFCGLTLLFLPLFLASALFKIGNLANDGVKLSARKGTCSSDPPIFEDDGNNSTMKSLWMHGVPISVFIHIITALCLLLPHLLLEAKLIQNQHLPKGKIIPLKKALKKSLFHCFASICFIFLDNIWKSEIDFIINRNDRLVILSFINTSPYQNDSNSNDNRFDNSVESLDYDLNPFETHESLQSYNTPTENLHSTLTGSSSIQISTFPEEEDYDLHEETTLRTSTYRITTSTTQLTTTITQPSTTTKIVKETTLPTTITSTLKTTLPTTTQSTTVMTNSPIVTERVHHGGKSNKSHNKNRKHNHRKHQKPHPPILELDDVDDINQEFKIEDFDSFDQELLRLESNKTNKKKNKGALKSSSEQARSTTTRNFESMERPRTTQKIFMETPKPTTAKTTMATKPKSKDSDIHIVKPETSVPSTATTTTTLNSKIIEIKPKTAGEKKSTQLSHDDSFEEPDDVLLMDSAMPSINEDAFIVREEKGDMISAAALVGSVPNFTQTNELDGIGGFIQSIVGTNEKFEPKQWFQTSPTLEFINLALALLVWSVRYPSVFWDSSKAFTMIFSLQMIANSIDILMLHVGTSILFKLQVVGQFMTVQNQTSPLLLNGIVTLALTLLAYVLIISSSMILYLYGHSRLSAKIRDCQMITLKDGDIWSYFSHCASLCFILALSVVKAPIIHDLTVTYRISLDGTVFASSKFSLNVNIFFYFIFY